MVTRISRGPEIAAQPKTRLRSHPPRRGVSSRSSVASPTLLNPHFAVAQDQDGSRIFYEPSWRSIRRAISSRPARSPVAGERHRRTGWQVGDLELKRGVTWHDGKPFTVDDLVFNWEYAGDPATGRDHRRVPRRRAVEKLDSHTAKVVFKNPTPYWFDAFCGRAGRSSPSISSTPIGAPSRVRRPRTSRRRTGPIVLDFKRRHRSRRDQPELSRAQSPILRPHRDEGGGDAASAARAVLQTGEFDFAWNLQWRRDPQALEQGARPRTWRPARGREHQAQQQRPVEDVDGERSSIKTMHPVLTDPPVRTVNLL